MHKILRDHTSVEPYRNGATHQESLGLKSQRDGDDDQHLYTPIEVLNLFNQAVNNLTDALKTLKGEEEDQRPVEEMVIDDIFFLIDDIFTLPFNGGISRKDLTEKEQQELELPLHDVYFDLLNMYDALVGNNETYGPTYTRFLEERFKDLRLRGVGILGWLQSQLKGPFKKNRLQYWKYSLEVFTKTAKFLGSLNDGAKGRERISFHSSEAQNYTIEEFFSLVLGIVGELGVAIYNFEPDSNKEKDIDAAISLLNETFHLAQNNSLSSDIPSTKDQMKLEQQTSLVVRHSFVLVYDAIVSTKGQMSEDYRHSLSKAFTDLKADGEPIQDWLQKVLDWRYRLRTLVNWESSLVILGEAAVALESDNE